MPDGQRLRRDALRRSLSTVDSDAALITRLVNVRYLTGFTGSNAALLVTADGRDVLATDGRYTTQAERQAPDVERLIVRAAADSLVAAAIERGHSSVAVETHDVSVDLHERLRTRAAEGGATRLVRLGQVVEGLRAVKDEDEIELLRQACAVADRAFARVLDRVTAGRTERELGIELEALMREEGGDGASFETIVATGPNSAVPHHRPTTRVVERGDFVKFDFGSVVGGYHSDMTRTVVVGRADDWQREVYDVVRAAQSAGVAAAMVGATTGEADKAARDVITAAGHGDDYPHSLGHGVGLEIHEAPTLAGGGSDILRDRTPVTVEPGVYLAGRGGVRIEDTLVVRAGGPELLTTTTKDLLVLSPRD
jgi:Xaa-Pro aminopeptidase